MGVVFKAQDTKLSRHVALKFLPSGAATSEEDIKRFHKEASALSALNHPNIATIYDIDEVEGQRFIALEYLPGGTVRSALKNLQSAGHEMPLRQIIEYGLQVAEALAHAHQHGITHRDIKTENLLLTADGKVKITDFGLAKLRGDVMLTKLGSTLGTAAYMSPEQTRGEEIDERSDIFSYGIVLYELTTGQLPFRGEHEASLMYSIVNSDPAAIGSVRQNVPPVLERLIFKCLEKEKEKRYRNCGDVITHLLTLQREITNSHSPRVMGRPRRAQAVWLGLVAVALSLIAVFLYVFVFPAAPSLEASPSIAVLYVENMTENPSFDSFTAGITEEIINELSNVPGLLVISRNDVRPYRGKAVDVRELGEKLGVSYILEGSVRVEGKRLRVTCQAIQTHDRFHFWSQGYTRELTSAFDVQSDIAQQVALALKTKFAQKNLEQKLGLPANSLLKQ